MAVNAHAPGRVQLGNNAALQFEHGVSRVIRGGCVGLTVLVHSLRNMSGSEGADRPNRGEKIVQHIAPMTKHIEDDSPSFFLPVIPGWPLGRLPISFENPIAELTAHRQDPSEKPVFRSEE